ncbi:hypothetical protein ACQKRQ_13820 [Paraburkholderia sp. NPDC080076]|uniref:hypothetical protein n=1 Tax=Paraburkholderia sp. NPDC080076 TaxID=3390605 RepID=UPI003D0664D9
MKAKTTVEKWSIPYEKITTAGGRTFRLRPSRVSMDRRIRCPLSNAQLELRATRVLQQETEGGRLLAPILFRQREAIAFSSFNHSQ